MIYQLAHRFGVVRAQYDIVHYMTDEKACEKTPRRARAEALRSQLINHDPC
jgi:glyceraldehyde-3-phosphate dehydrogenase/erythrose-4-phosphate dehydrogenase